MGRVALHVRLDVLDGAQLVRRLLEAERGLELALPGRVRGKRRPLGDGATRVELEELLGHLANGRPHRLLDALPGAAAHAVEPRRARGRAHVLGDEVEPLDGQVEPAALGVLEQEEVRRRGRRPTWSGARGSGRRRAPRAPPGRWGLRSVKAAMAWPRWKTGRRSRRRRAPKMSSSARTTRPSAGSWKPAAQSPAMTPSPSPLQRVAPGPGLEIVLGQDAPEAGGLLLVVHDEAHGEALGPPVADLARQLLEAALEAAHRARAHGDARHARRRRAGAAAARAAGSRPAPRRAARRRARPRAALRAAPGRRAPRARRAAARPAAGRRSPDRRRAAAR